MQCQSNCDRGRRLPPSRLIDSTRHRRVHNDQGVLQPIMPRQGRYCCHRAYQPSEDRTAVSSCPSRSTGTGRDPGHRPPRHRPCPPGVEHGPPLPVACITRRGSDPYLPPRIQSLHDGQEPLCLGPQTAAAGRRGCSKVAAAEDLVALQATIEGIVGLVPSGCGTEFGKERAFKS